MIFFVEKWNSYQIRQQKDLHSPIGIKDQKFSFPEDYVGTKNGFQVSVNFLSKAAEESEVFQENQDFLDVPLSTRL